MEAGASSKQNFWQTWNSALLEIEAKEQVCGGATFTTCV